MTAAPMPDSTLSYETPRPRPALWRSHLTALVFSLVITLLSAATILTAVKGSSVLPAAIAAGIVFLGPLASAAFSLHHLIRLPRPGKVLSLLALLISLAQLSCLTGLVLAARH